MRCRFDYAGHQIERLLIEVYRFSHLAVGFNALFATHCWSMPNVGVSVRAVEVAAGFGPILFRHPANTIFRKVGPTLWLSVLVGIARELLKHLRRHPVPEMPLVEVFAHRG